MVVYEFFFCFFAYRLTNVQFLSHDDHDDDHDDDESWGETQTQSLTSLSESQTHSQSETEWESDWESDSEQRHVTAQSQMSWMTMRMIDLSYWIDLSFCVNLNHWLRLKSKSIWWFVTTICKTTHSRAFMLSFIESHSLPSLQLQVTYSPPPIGRSLTQNDWLDWLTGLCTVTVTVKYRVCNYHYVSYIMNKLLYSYCIVLSNHWLRARLKVLFHSSGLRRTGRSRQTSHPPEMEWKGLVWLALDALSDARPSDGLPRIPSNVHSLLVSY